MVIRLSVNRKILKLLQDRRKEVDIVERNEVDNPAPVFVGLPRNEGSHGVVKLYKSRDCPNFRTKNIHYTEKNKNSVSFKQNTERHDLYFRHLQDQVLESYVRLFDWSNRSIKSNKGKGTQ